MVGQESSSMGKKAQQSHSRQHRARAAQKHRSAGHKGHQATPEFANACHAASTFLNVPAAYMHRVARTCAAAKTVQQQSNEPAPVQQRGDDAAGGPQLLEPPDAVAQPHAQLLRGCRQAGRQGGRTITTNLRSRVTSCKASQRQIPKLQTSEAAAALLPCWRTHLACRLAGPAAAGRRPPARELWCGAHPPLQHPVRKRNTAPVGMPEDATVTHHTGSITGWEQGSR